jgi:hypothetical protein
VEIVLVAAILIARVFMPKVYYTPPKGIKCSGKYTNGGRKDVATAIRVRS